MCTVTETYTKQRLCTYKTLAGKEGEGKVCPSTLKQPCRLTLSMLTGRCHRRGNVVTLFKGLSATSACHMSPPLPGVPSTVMAGHNSTVKAWSLRWQMVFVIKWVHCFYATIITLLFLESRYFEDCRTNKQCVHHYDHHYTSLIP